MYLIVTRSFPPEVGGMQNLMWGLTYSLSKYDLVKVFADYNDNYKEHDKNVSFSIDRVGGIKFLRKHRKACLMSNHGQVAFGNNLEEAFELALEIENICHQYVIALKIGDPKILSFEEMKKVLEKAKNYKKE